MRDIISKYMNILVDFESIMRWFTGKWMYEFYEIV
jgi:hypothetical protein